MGKVPAVGLSGDSMGRVLRDSTRITFYPSAFQILVYAFTLIPTIEGKIARHLYVFYADYTWTT